MEALRGELADINKKLAVIESLLQQLPEVQAAVYIKMNEEYQTSKLQRLASKELWTI